MGNWKKVREHKEVLVHVALAGNAGLVLSHVYFPEADFNWNI